jgi:hypothetical protein
MRKAFFYGSGKSKHFAQGQRALFFEYVERVRESRGDGVLAKQPLYCTVDSEVAFMADGILSIKQSFDRPVDGLRTLHYYGSTFDLRTGELLTFDRFVRDGKEEFKAEVLSKLRESFSLDEDGFYNREHFLKRLEKDVGEHEFYCDGQGIRLVFNEDIRTAMGFIVRYPDTDILRIP